MTILEKTKQMWTMLPQIHSSLEEIFPDSPTKQELANDYLVQLNLNDEKLKENALNDFLKDIFDKDMINRNDHHKRFFSLMNKREDWITGSDDERSEAVQLERDKEKQEVDENEEEWIAKTKTQVKEFAKFLKDDNLLNAMNE